MKIIRLHVCTFQTSSNASSVLAHVIWKTNWWKRGNIKKKPKKKKPFCSNAERPARPETGAVLHYSTNVEPSSIGWSLTCHTFTFPHLNSLIFKRWCTCSGFTKRMQKWCHITWPSHSIEGYDGILVCSRRTWCLHSAGVSWGAVYIYPHRKADCDTGKRNTDKGTGRDYVLGSMTVRSSKPKAWQRKEIQNKAQKFLQMVRTEEKLKKK